MAKLVPNEAGKGTFIENRCVWLHAGISPHFVNPVGEGLFIPFHSLGDLGLTGAVTGPELSLLIADLDPAIALGSFHIHCPDLDKRA